MTGVTIMIRMEAGQTRNNETRTAAMDVANLRGLA
jgi:hypothetical protein